MILTSFPQTPTLDAVFSLNFSGFNAKRQKKSNWTPNGNALERRRRTFEGKPSETEEYKRSISARTAFEKRRLRRKKTSACEQTDVLTLNFNGRGEFYSQMIVSTEPPGGIIGKTCSQYGTRRSRRNGPSLSIIRRNASG